MFHSRVFYVVPAQVQHFQMRRVLSSGTHSLLLLLHSSSDYREKSKYSLIPLVNLNIQYLKLREETYFSDSSLHFVSSSPAVGRTTKSRSGLQSSEPRLLLTIHLYVWLKSLHVNRAYIFVLFLCFASMNTHTLFFSSRSVIFSIQCRVFPLLSPAGCCGSGPALWD